MARAPEQLQLPQFLGSHVAVGPLWEEAGMAQTSHLLLVLPPLALSSHLPRTKGTDQVKPKWEPARGQFMENMPLHTLPNSHWAIFL